MHTIEGKLATPAPGVRYVGIYCRLSPRPDGSYEGVEDQEKWGREYAARVWPGMPVIVFADKGISAMTEDVRPEYDELRECIRTGAVVHVWTVEQARIERKISGKQNWFELADEMDAAGIEELHTMRDGILRVLDEVAAIKAVLANSEVRKLRKRTRDRLEAKARLGQPAGAIPWGYERTTMSGVNQDGQPIKIKTLRIVEERAMVIREAAERVLSGWSLSGIAADFAARGIETPGGGRMVGDTVKRMLVKPGVAGKRVHRGNLYTGNWPAILDEGTWQGVLAKLGGPRTVSQVDGETYEVTKRALRRTAAPRKYTITGGLSVCDVCEAPLYGTLKRRYKANGEEITNERQTAYLICHKTNGGKACVGIQIHPTQEFVVDELFRMLDKPGFLAAVSADDSAARREELTTALTAVETKRRRLSVMWAEDRLDDAEWEVARASLDQREHALREELNELPVADVAVDIDELRAAWPDMMLDEQCAVLRRYIAEIRIKKAVPGSRSFDNDRIAITWKRARRTLVAVSS